MSLARYIGRRLIWTAVTLIGAVFVIFILTQAVPGDAALQRVGKSFTPETLAAVRASMGLDRPLPIQFAVYVQNLFQGDLGHSWKTGNAVTLDLKQRLPATIELMLWTLIVSIPLGILLGVAAAAQGGWFSRILQGYIVMGLGIPVFWLSLMAVYIFFFRLGWAPPPTGRLPILDEPPPVVTGLYTFDSLIAGDTALLRQSLAHLALPVLSLTFIVVAPIARMTQSCMATELASDHIRAAMAAGIGRGLILRRFALKNIMIPIVTLIAVIARFLIGGMVLTEMVFSWPGIGRYAIESTLVADLAPLQAVMLVVTVATLLINLLVDVSYFYLNPRIKVA